jgi:hypothetical protein
MHVSSLLSQKSRLRSAADLPLNHTQRKLDKLEAIFLVYIVITAIHFVVEKKSLTAIKIHLFYYFINLLPAVPDFLILIISV